MFWLLFLNVCFLVGVEYWCCVFDLYLCDCVLFIFELCGLFEVSGWLELVMGVYFVMLGEVVCFYYLDGYMFGLMMVEVGGVVFCVDLIFGCYWVYLLIIMGYDCWLEKLIEEKCEFLEDKFVCGVCLFFIYDYDCVLVVVSCDVCGCFGILYEWLVLVGVLFVMEVV